jgi:hypothetical protein
MTLDKLRISHQEARDALEAVRAVARRTRRAISAGGGGQIMMIWGLAWAAGFLGSHFLPERTSGALWGLVDLAGIAATLWIVWRASRLVRDPLGPRIGGFWLMLTLYTVLLLWLAGPLTGLQTGVLICCAAMFGYVVMGLWLDLTFFWVGLGVTALTLAGYLAVPTLFDLWMAVVGGGTLLASGYRIHRRWA